MKIFSKPISSPNRTEKFPPPLLMFMRSNGGNKSRGRCRSSPMFIRKKSEAVNETQEPCSPKVTCMGQVRVRRSKQAIATKRRWRCIKKALFCNRFNVKRKLRTSRPFWGRWFVFFQVGYRRKVDIMEASATRETKREETEEDQDTEDEAADVFVSSSPPKNALLLTRCRSEPYRTSSLANRFSASEKPVEDQAQQSNEEDNPTSKKESLCRDSEAESRTEPEFEEKLGFCEGFESSSDETTKIADENSKIDRTPDRPLILTRCKSEPARRSEKLDSDTCFWKKRLGFF